MTITNHAQRIEQLAGDVVRHADDRAYHQAHSALDDIEIKCRLIHRHIDHLQNVSEFAARPPGGT